MTTKRRVAVTGMGAVTSLGVKVVEIWQNLLAQKSGISKIEKFDASGYRCQFASEIKNFDPTGWIEPRDIRRLDLFSQYALVAAACAVKDANLALDKEDMSRIGVIAGSGMGGMTVVEEQEDVIRRKGPRGVSPYFIPSLMINAISAEIAIRYGFKGINFVTASACSSSAHAIGQGLRAIQYGEADVIITGGSEAVITPLSIAGFCASRALSQRNDQPQQASRPFDKERDGFVIGEGSAIIVLEEMTRAKDRGARIYAELAGIGWNSDAYHITQPSPNAEGAARAIASALKDAGISRDDVDYINAHGTSTKHNDRVETLAIKKVFGDMAYRIPISSTKSMLGHLLGAAGAVESMVVAMSVFHNQLHATANYQYPDPECDLDYISDGSRETKVKSGLSNSFGFGGHNVCLAFKKVEN